MLVSGLAIFATAVVVRRGTDREQHAGIAVMQHVAASVIAHLDGDSCWHRHRSLLHIKYT